VKEGVAAVVAAVDRSPSLLGPGSTGATSVVRGSTLGGFRVEVEEAAVAVVDRTPLALSHLPLTPLAPLHLHLSLLLHP